MSAALRRRPRLVALEGRIAPAIFTVINTNDSGTGSLRQAILDANALFGADSILFDPGVFATAKMITLTSGEIPVTGPLAVNGTGSSQISISGNNSSRVFNISPTTDIDVTIIGLTITAGNSTMSGTENGGGINILHGNVTLTDVVAKECNAPSQSGGAIGITGGKLTASYCRFANNLTFGAGGAIYSAAPVTIVDCSFTANSSRTGGAVYAWKGLVVNRCLFTGNATTSAGGGAIGLDLDGAVLIQNSTISNNSASEIGGGIYVYAGQKPLMIQNCTIIDNSAAAVRGGGGLAGDTGTAIITLQSTVISNNKANGSSNKDLYRAGQIAANNCAVGTAAGVTTFVADSATTALLGMNFKLGPLSNNGGPTLTHALLPGSPCIDAGANPANLTTDQRGYLRVYGTAPDIGAYELQPPRVLSVVVNGGDVQRSRDNHITVNFDSTVMLPMAVESAFQLKRQSDGAVVTLLGVVTQGPQTSVDFTFTGGPIEFGSLADGRYTLTVLASQISGGNFDGNGDGVPGDDYVLAGTPANGLFRLFGDADGNGTINIFDVNAFRTAFGGNSFAFDFDGSGTVDVADFLAFRSRFGSSI